jgi:hypothetical protein
MFGRKKYIPHPSASRDGKRRDIVGESFHEKVLQWALEESHNGVKFDIALVPEPSNRHDKNAIRVDLLTRRGPRPVGHIAKTETKKWHPILRAAPRNTYFTWPADITGGYGAHIGVQFFVRA